MMSQSLLSIIQCRVYSAPHSKRVRGVAVSDSLAKRNEFASGTVCTVASVVHKISNV